MQQAIVRLVVLIIFLVNQTLVVLGWNPLPFSEEQIYEGVSSIVLAIVAIWTWYKNNNITKEAQEVQKELDKKKAEKKER